jgi:hypothetical protein
VQAEQCAHEGFGERSRWGAGTAPRYRSALSNNRRAEPHPTVKPVIDLLARIVTASVETAQIVYALPELAVLDIRR